MAALTRYTQKLFGSTSAAAMIKKFGGLAASDTGNVTTPAQIQSLANWLGGWPAAILGNNSPTLEDMNSMCYVFAYQLAYLMQTGAPEWDSGTTYFIGDRVRSGAQIFVSLTDNNLANAVTSVTNWAAPNPVRESTIATTVALTDETVVMIGVALIACNLPALSTVPIGKRFTIKNSSVSNTGVTLTPNGSDAIDKGGAGGTILLNSYPIQESITLQKSSSSAIWRII